MSSFELTPEDDQVTKVFLECMKVSQFRFWDSNAPYDMDLCEYDWDKATEFSTEFVFVDVEGKALSRIEFTVHKKLYQHLDELVWFIQNGSKGGLDDVDEW